MRLSKAVEGKGVVMKHIQFFIASILVSLIVGMVSISAHEVFKMEAAAEWRAAEKPDTREKALDLDKEAGARKKEALEEQRSAEERLKKAEKEGDKGEKEKAERDIKEWEVRKQQAEYDLATAQIKLEEDALGKVQTDDAKQKIRESVEKTRNEQRSLSESLEKLSRDLGLSFEAPRVEESVGSRQVVNEYIAKSTGVLTETNLKIKSEIEKFVRDVKKNTTYGEQQELLSHLVKKLNEKIEALSKEDVKLKKDLEKTVENMQKRLDQINEFLKSPPKPELSQNPLASELGLHTKIREDQLFAIKDFFLKKIRNKEDVGRTQLDQLLNAIDHFDLKELIGKDGIRDALEARKNEIAKATQKEERPSEFTEQDEKLLSDTEELAKLGQQADQPEPPATFYDKIASVAQFTIDTMNKGLGYAWEKKAEVAGELLEDIQEAGKEVKKVAEIAEKISHVMETAPKVVALVVDTAVAAQATAEKIEGLVQMVPGSENVLYALDLVKAGGEEMKKYEPVLQKLAETSKSASGFVRGAAHIAEKFGGFVSDRAADMKKTILPEQEEVLANVDRALDMIEEERANITREEKKSRFVRVTEAIADYGRRFANWLKESVFKVTATKIEKASQAYTQARGNYLKALGFTDEAIAGAINEGAVKEKLVEIGRLQGAQRAMRERTIKARAETLAQATSDYVKIYDEVAEKLQGAVANHAYLVDMWDEVIEKKPEDIADFVTAIFDMRDLRAQFLIDMRAAIKSMKEDVASLIAGPSRLDIAGKFIRSVEHVTDKALLDSIARYNQQIEKVEEQVKKFKVELEKTIEGKKAAQAPPGG